MIVIEVEAFSLALHLPPQRLRSPCEGGYPLKGDRATVSISADLADQTVERLGEQQGILSQRYGRSPPPSTGS